MFSLIFLHSKTVRKHLCFSSLYFNIFKGYSQVSLWSKIPLLPIPSVTTTILLPAPCWLIIPSAITRAGPKAVCPWLQSPNFMSRLSNLKSFIFVQYSGPYFAPILYRLSKSSKLTLYLFICSVLPPKPYLLSQMTVGFFYLSLFAGSIMTLLLKNINPIVLLTLFFFYLFAPNPPCLSIFYEALLFGLISFTSHSVRPINSLFFLR